MRSTNLDNWNLNYLRNMRVGGNKAAKEYFSKNGGSRYLSSSANAKEKYTSAVAKKYLQELARLSSADARKYPGEEALTLEAPSLGAKSDSDSNLSDISSSNNSSDDFFSSWDRPLVKKPTPPVSRSATPINRNSSPLTKSAAKPADAAATITTSRIVPAAKKSNILGTRKTGNSSILNTKKPKFVAKKVTGDEIDFEAAEKAAKEEAEHISKLGYNPNEDAAPVSAASNVTVHKLASTSTTSNSTASSNVSAPKTEEVRKKFVKLGFGQTSAPAAPESTPSRSSTPSRKIAPSPASDGTVVAKFGGQKAISSDQMFGRNAYDPTAQAEAKTRLQAFGGATSISSSSYFGRDEEEEQAARGAGGEYSGVERAATEIADRMRNMANDDFSALKDALDQGASKLSGLMRDYLK